DAAAAATLTEWKSEASRARYAKPNASREACITEIPLEQLEDSLYQLRHDMDSDALAELTRSIEENGLLNPILARRKGDKYEVISGHRRLAAYRRPCRGHLAARCSARAAGAAKASPCSEHCEEGARDDRSSAQQGDAPFALVLNRDPRDLLQAC